MNLKLAYNPTTRVATVLLQAGAIPAGSTNIGNFVHDSPDPLGSGDSHVVFHHVRDLLYKRSHANPANEAMFPFNITDMDRISIVIDPTVVLDPILATGVKATPDTVSLVVGATQQITHTVQPNQANQDVTYTSSDATKATVSGTGLITAVAAGTANITVKVANAAFTDVVAVTVTAA